MLRLLWKLLCVLAAVMAGFAYWGIFTYEGQHSFDEMAGTLPYLAGLGSVIFATAGILIFLLNWQRRRSSHKP